MPEVINEKVLVSLCWVMPVIGRLRIMDNVVSIEVRGLRGRRIYQHNYSSIDLFVFPGRSPFGATDILISGEKELILVYPIKSDGKAIGKALRENGFYPTVSKSAFARFFTLFPPTPLLWWKAKGLI